MLLALALYASTAHAGIPAGFGGTPGVVNENTLHYDPEVQELHHPDSDTGRPCLDAYHATKTMNACRSVRIVMWLYCEICGQDIIGVDWPGLFRRVAGSAVPSVRRLAMLPA